MDDRVRRFLSAADARLATALPTEHAVRLASLRASVGAGAHGRVLVVGRAKSGRSTLLDAVGAEGPWASSGVVWRTMTKGPVLVEAPGFRGSLGAAAVSLAATVAAVWKPTRVVFAIAASEVDAGIDDDLDDLRDVVASAGRAPALVSVLTRVDELAPPEVWPPTVPEKMRAVSRAIDLLTEHLRRRTDLAVSVGRSFIPVSALVEPDYDRRWNVASVTAALRDPARTPTAMRALERFAQLWKACAKEGFAVEGMTRGWEDGRLVAALAQ